MKLSMCLQKMSHVQSHPSTWGLYKCSCWWGDSLTLLYKESAGSRSSSVISSIITSSLFSSYGFTSCPSGSGAVLLMVSASASGRLWFTESSIIFFIFYFTAHLFSYKCLRLMEKGWSLSNEDRQGPPRQFSSLYRRLTFATCTSIMTSPFRLFGYVSPWILCDNIYFVHWFKNNKLYEYKTEWTTKHQLWKLWCKILQLFSQI